MLEVILALAILAGALAALGEVLRLSGVNANAAADLSRAQLLAASKMSEIKSGVIELSVANRSPFELETTPRWVYSIDWEPTIEEDIIAVRVTVEQDLPAEKQPIQYSLVRWMIDPDVQLAAASESTSAATSDSATSGSTAPASGAGR